MRLAAEASDYRLTSPFPRHAEPAVRIRFPPAESPANFRFLPLAPVEERLSTRVRTASDRIWAAVFDPRSGRLDWGKRAGLVVVIRATPRECSPAPAWLFSLLPTLTTVHRMSSTPMPSRTRCDYTPGQLGLFRGWYLHKLEEPGRTHSPTDSHGDHHMASAAPFARSSEDRPGQSGLQLHPSRLAQWPNCVRVTPAGINPHLGPRNRLARPLISFIKVAPDPSEAPDYPSPLVIRGVRLTK